MANFTTEKCSFCEVLMNRGITGIFFCVKCFCPVENSPFGRPKTNFSCFEKRKANEKKKKGSSALFVTFPPSIFNFPPSIFNPFSIFHLPFFHFPSFLLHFPYFPCLSFPDTSAKISRSEIFGGILPPCPPLVTPLLMTTCLVKVTLIKLTQ